VRTGGPARTVALRACISMRGEQRERGAREKLGRKRDEDGWEGRTRKEGRTEERLRLRQPEQENEGQKDWQKGTFRTFFVC